MSAASIEFVPMMCGPDESLNEFHMHSELRTQMSPVAFTLAFVAQSTAHAGKAVPVYVGAKCHAIEFDAASISRMSMSLVCIGDTQQRFI
mmetsp:Transcript_2172/g.5886  ORF Transcript_2172/g.5886 Transcript_2172/m.5886 type:complete len:90 (-) Transcript_2172:1337-1606(-)